MITLTYAYKLKPTKQQLSEIDNILDVCRSMWNYALRERKDWSASRKCPVNSCSLHSEYIINAEAPYPNFAAQCKSLTQAKKDSLRLKSVNAQVLQQVLRTLDKAFADMKVRGFGLPRFKKKMRSFVFPSMLKDCLSENKVKLPQLGWIRIKQSRAYPQGFEVKQARVVRKASGYYLMLVFQSQESVPDALPGSKSLGLDAGIESFVAASDGELIKSPKFLVHAQRKLKLLQRRLKLKKRGSSNWLKLQKKIGRLHERVANARKDWHFKLAHLLCNRADNLFVEDINFTSWSKGIVSKQSLDSGIGGFINEILPFVCWKRGKYYAKVDKNYSSQTCPNCGCRMGKKKLSERLHHCFECGYRDSRDVAAAKVIEQRGKTAVGQPVVYKNACGDDATGFRQLNLLEKR